MAIHGISRLASEMVIIFGFNTNGNLNNQLTQPNKYQLRCKDSHRFSVINHAIHNPNSHHPVESKVKAFCDSLTKSIPAGVKILYIAAHNHQLASTADGTKFISGGGGRSHYDCGTDAVWNFCNNKDYGFLELTIDNMNGATAAKFIK